MGDTTNTEGSATPAGATPAATPPATPANQTPPESGASSTPPQGATPTGGNDPAAGSRPNALTSATTTPAPEHFGIPEKHRVFKADGSLDIEASTTKVAQAYNERETQLGKLGKAPQSPGDYKLTAPTHLQGEFSTEDFQGFMEKAHAAGITQSQMDVVSGSFFEYADKLINGKLELDREECDATLAKVWTTPEAKSAGYGNAMRAFQTFGGDRKDQVIAKFGNDPDAIWLMSMVGAQLKESSSLPQSGSAATTDLSQAYADLGSTDPVKRAAAEKAVRAAAEAKAAAQKRA